MARSASVGVERSTKAYPTGRSVRGFLGIEVDSLVRRDVSSCRSNLESVHLHGMKMKLADVCELPNNELLHNCA